MEERLVRMVESKLINQSINQSILLQISYFKRLTKEHESQLFIIWPPFHSHVVTDKNMAKINWLTGPI